MTPTDQLLELVMNESLSASMTRRNLVLWGYNPNPNYGLTQPIKLADYRSQKQQDQWRKEGWVTGVYGAGDEPLGLILLTERMRKKSQLAEASR